MDPIEDYKSPFSFEEGFNTNYLYLSPKESFTPLSSPALPCRGSQRPDSIPEVGEDAASALQPAFSTALTEEEQEELRSELVKVEEEIQTLTQVLASKERHLAEIKRKLGITPFNELKQNLSKSWQEVTTSTAYKRTSETLSQAGQKATAAFSSVGSAISRKLEDVSIRSIQHSTSMPVMRNTPTFKSFEDKVDSLKTKVSPTASSTELGIESESTPSAEPVVKQPEGTTVLTPELQ
ncbi:tumor protein D52 isoform X1 [Tachysurus fulvidraco]|uniref:tumor protein D52 isoform X1 n=1 Tax=Tachysurus fulvidraco TaxID=1234273 RepID=UPI000F4DA47F|nr:tumor protein D52 isoform X1 [Tachysurus fulvidraco]